MCQFNARVRERIDVEPAGRSTTESSWSQVRIGPQIFTEVPPAAVHLARVAHEDRRGMERHQKA
jgi:hypothetical protein